MLPSMPAARLRAALDAASGLPPEDVQNVDVLVRAGEWAVALETLCTQIHEYDVPVDTAQRALLETLGGDYGVQVGRLLGET